MVDPPKNEMLRNIKIFSVTIVLPFLMLPALGGQQSKNDQAADRFVSNTRQMTFSGRRTGEGYYNADGTRIVFQSERHPGNPFYQIYMLDLETGDSQRISPGHGKTTCAWIHPNNQVVMFSSTHDDPKAREKQLEEIKLRESGKQRRYAWDYDEHFEIYARDIKSGKYTNLTKTRGYDAEGSYSPDGKLIAFASNRHAYTEKLTDKQKKTFELDKSFMMDLYIMNADGTSVKRLTNTLGYDGGPFFSPDGKRICWRRFSEDGVRAEIWTMNIDGTDQKQLTRMEKMSWAPYYHPSGKYLIFNTNKHGFGNFELYVVDAGGTIQPIRVTNTEGFDGLATFTPDGKTLTWTSNRVKEQSQLFTANWDHQAVLKAIGESKVAKRDDRKKPKTVKTSAQYRAADVLRHVQKLCSPEMEGRMTGSRGERLATEYVAAYLESLGLQPAGEKNNLGKTDWFQYFEFPSGTSLGKSNDLKIASTDAKSKLDIKLNETWRPLSFSGNGEFDGEVVFAGYGIAAPKTKKFAEYDSYVHLDVKDKWVMVFRYLPEDITPEHRQHLQFYSTLRRKATLARDKGARGLIIVSGPTSNVQQQLVPLQNGSSRDATSMAVISVNDAFAQHLLKSRDLKQLQSSLDKGQPSMGFALKGVKLAASIEIKKRTGKGRNVIGRLQAGDKPSKQVIVIGAHIDHLGRGISGSSLAKENELGQIHHGADDNASGVAAMLEIAEYLAHQKKTGKLKLKRDVVFAGWSGEELNLYGSKHFVAELKKELHPHSSHGQGHHGNPHAPESNPHAPKSNPHGKKHADGSAHSRHGKSSTHGHGKKSTTTNPHSTDPHAVNPHASHGANPHSQPKLNIKPGGIYPRVAAYLNLDMIGRYNKSLILQGLGSSRYWKPVIERRNVVVRLNLTLSDDTNLPTDAREFYGAGVPILAAFTGSHSDYHSPRDTPEKLNYDRTAEIAKLLGLITRELVSADSIPNYTEYKGEAQLRRGGGMRATLGTVPDYGGDIKGVLLSGVRKGTPAEKAGIKGGDVIVGLAGRKIENIYDYTYAIEALKIGQKVKIKVKRGDKVLELDIVPASRD